MMQRINSLNYKNLATKAELPSYSPNDHGVGIVHIGSGAFHRGHQAVFTDQALANSGGDWRIAGVSLRSAAASQQLNPQTGLYTVIERSDGYIGAKVIASIKEVISARLEQTKVIDYLASPSTKIITLTVTEKGYHYNQSTGAINWQSKDIQHDVLHPHSPISMPGYLVLACKKRMEGMHPLSSKLTIISCDNLPENGHIVESVVISLASKLDSALLNWISENVTFCSSMVDRIVPRVTDDSIQQQGEKWGYLDKGLVITEPFKQWVIEDNFCTERPNWESAGVLYVNDVCDYEKLKLRTLNGSHSALAYMGVLIGHEWIHEAMRDPLLSQIIEKLMQQETGPTIASFDHFDLPSYQQQIVARFLNSDIAYATQQVAMDGSQKLQQRILAPMAELYAAGKVEQTKCLMGTLVCWLRYLKRETESGDKYEISDPNADLLTKIVDTSADNPQKLIDALFEQTSVIPAELKCRDDFRQNFIAQLNLVNHIGIKNYLQTLLD